MDQSMAAQSQPDLLGLPYTTHENVLMRKRNINNTLSVSPTELNSRLSMPAFVFSCTSLRSFENAPSTSSSYANDMTLRASGNEGENTGESSEADDASVNEQVNRNLNYEFAASSNSMQTNTRSACGSLSATISDMIASEVENNQSSTSVAPSTSTNSETILDEENSDGTNEIRDVDTNNISLDNCSEHNSHISELETNAEADVSETVLEEDDPATNEGNNENRSDVNETEDFSAETNMENTNTEYSTNESALVFPLEVSLFVDNSLTAQQDSTVSVENAPSSEGSSSSLQQLSQHEVLTVVDLPPDEPDTSLGERDFTAVQLFGPVINATEGTSSDILQENNNIDINSANRPNASTVNDSRILSVNETRDSTNASTSSLEPSHGQLDIPDENNISQNSVQHLNMTVDSFMDLESEPDIMNVLSLSNATTFDIVMPTQSADIEGTSPRRTVGTCNLRTLFQIPDRESEAETVDNSLGRIQQDDTTPSEEASAVINVSGNSDTIQPDIETLGHHDSSASNVGTGLSNSDLGAHGTADISDILPNSDTSVVENSSSSGLLSGGGNNELDDTDNGQYQMEQASTEEARTTSDSTEDELSRNWRLENSQSTPMNASLMSQRSINDEARSQRATLPSPIPSITHVRYLRSKNVSIRLPSRTASPLPVVHVVPPDVPVFPRNSESEFPSTSIEAEPILPATPVDSPVQGLRPVATRSLARDVFDAPDGSWEIVNAGASTSHSGASLSEATPGIQTSSVSGASHSGPKRRSLSGSSHSGNAKNKRTNKSRNRTNRNSATEPTEGAESLGQVRSSQRIIEERPNRNYPDNTTEETNGESSPSDRPASIYVQISDFASDEDVLDEPLPPRK